MVHKLLTWSLKGLVSLTAWTLLPTFLTKRTNIIFVYFVRTFARWSILVMILMHVRGGLLPFPMILRSLIFYSILDSRFSVSYRFDNYYRLWVTRFTLTAKEFSILVSCQLYNYCGVLESITSSIGWIPLRIISIDSWSSALGAWSGLRLSTLNI